MAKVSTGWLGLLLRGKADKKDETYIRVYEKTGRMCAVHRSKKTKAKSTAGQIAARKRFALTSKACAEFVRMGKEAVALHEPSPLAEAYLSVVVAFNEQREVEFLRSFIMKHYVVVNDAGKVEITVDDYVFTYPSEE